MNAARSTGSTLRPERGRRWVTGPLAAFFVVRAGVGPVCRRCGYGADVVRTLVGRLLGFGGQHRVRIDPAVDETTAVRCCEKVGFPRVGVFREYWKDDAGQWRDGVLLGLIAGDFADGREGGHGDR